MRPEIEEGEGSPEGGKVSGPSSGQAQQESASWNFIMTAQISAGFVAVIVALMMMSANIANSLVGATLALAAIIFLYLAVNLLWSSLSVRGASHGHDDGSPLSMAAMMAKGTQMVVTVQGVTLGLIFAFAGKGDVGITVKVGAAALVIGVILGLLLNTLVLHSVSTIQCLAMAGILYSATIWSACYGLVCIAASLLNR